MLCRVVVVSYNIGWALLYGLPSFFQAHFEQPNTLWYARFSSAEAFLIALRILTCGAWPLILAASLIALMLENRLHAEGILLFGLYLWKTFYMFDFS